MEFWMDNLRATSNTIDADVLAQYRRCDNDQKVTRWLQQEMTQLAHDDLEKSNTEQQEVWLKRLFMNLRLHWLRQVGEGALIARGPMSSTLQAAQIEVLDILAEPGDWARVCALGAGTYEMLVHRLCALAMMEGTLAISAAEYVTRFCTEYVRFSEPQATAQAQRHWLPLLLSVRQALKASPLLENVEPREKVDAPLARMSERRARAASKQVQYPPVFSSWRERVVSFGCAFGLFFVGFAAVLAPPALIFADILQRTQASPVEKTAATLRLPVKPEPTLTPVVTPATKDPLPATPEVPATPVPTPKPEVMATPVSSPVVELTERAGFYVIGMAAREEASAQAEAQKHRQDGLQPRVVYSSNWSGLTPNYYQVVYGIFANRADTAALRKDLEKRGIKTYVMHSGQRVR